MFNNFIGGPNMLVSGEDFTPLEEKIFHEKVSKYIKTAPKEKDFNNFSQKDLDYVERIKRQNGLIKKSMQANLWEAILAEQSEMSDWLGNCHTFKTTEYDYYTNHVDMVVEWKSPTGEPIRIAIDATVSEDKEVINEKTSRIIKTLDKGAGFKTKYYESQIEDKQKSLYNLPLVVLGFNKENLKKLCAILSESKEEQNKYFNNEKTITRKDFGKINIQFSIIDEIIDQLEAQKQMLEKRGFIDTEIYKNVVSAINLLEKISKEKDSPDIIDLGEPLNLTKISSYL